MIEVIQPIRLLSYLDRREWTRDSALLAAAAALDALAVGILLLGSPHARVSAPPWLEGLVAGAAHLAAVVAVSGVGRVRPGRRGLCLAAVLALPGIGLAVATSVLFTTGRGSDSWRLDRRVRRRAPPDVAAIRRWGSALSPCDALERGTGEQRRDALWALSREGGPEAIALLRRATAGRDPDLALSAALALDEIAERTERIRTRPEANRLQHDAG